MMEKLKLIWQILFSKSGSVPLMGLNDALKAIDSELNSEVKTKDAWLSNVKKFNKL